MHQSASLSRLCGALQVKMMHYLYSEPHLLTQAWHLVTYETLWKRKVDE